MKKLFHLQTHNTYHILRFFCDWKNITIPNYNGHKLLTFTQKKEDHLSTHVSVCPEASLFMIVLKCSHLVHIPNKTKYKIFIVFIYFCYSKRLPFFCFFFLLSFIFVKWKIHVCFCLSVVVGVWFLFFVFFFKFNFI